MHPTDQLTHNGRSPHLGWRERRAGRLQLRYRERSAAAREIDDRVARYAEALATVAERLDLDADCLPPITVYLAEPPLAEQPDGRPADGSLVVRSAQSNESPREAPEAELTRALLLHLLGDGAAARFWDEGLAGYLATSARDSAEQGQASNRCRQLVDQGLLPPLEELVETAEGRVSDVVSTAAAAFADYLIGCYGLARYLALLRAVRDDAQGGQPAFEQVYGCPLAVADRDWRRTLDAAELSGAGSTWDTLRKLAPFGRPYWPAGLTIVGCTLVTLAFTLSLPLAFRFLIDNVLGRRPLGQYIPLIGPSGHVIAPGQEQIDSLVKLLALLGVLYLLNAAARLRLNATVNTVSQALVFDLRRRLLDLLARLPVATFGRMRQADLHQRVVQDTMAVQQVVTRVLVPVTAAVLSIVLFTALLVSLEPRLTLVAGLGLPILWFIYHLRRKARRAASREQVRRMADLSGLVNELIGAQVLVKAYRAAPYLLQRLVGRMDVHRRLNVAFAQENSVLGQAGGLVMNLTQMAVLAVGGFLVVASDGRDLAPGALVAFYLLLNQLFGPLQQITAASQNLVGAGASIERVIELLGERPESDRAGAVELGPLRRAIRFEGVSFAYPGGRPALRGVDCELPAGATVALVGPTGGGKSSVVNLLPRLHDPSKGRITWDGVDLREARLDSLRGQVVLVPQEPILLNTTLYENIRFGLDGVDDPAVHRAAKLAQAHDFICELSSGYDTIVGELGVGLSGGQRQRVALARALLRRPSVLILDEATSALDATTQRAAAESVREAAAGCLVLKIAHRLETIADADLIFVFEDGRLVERGSHAELQAAGGVYARLLEDQLSTAADAPDAGRPGAAGNVRMA